MQPVVNYDHKTIQVRRGSTTEWRRYGAICIPAEGEICVEFFQDADGSRNGNTGMKVGNGTSNYADLPYLITNQNQDDRISDDQINNWDLTVEKLANLVASEVGQTNADLGDNVQEALNDLHNRLLAIDPDGGSIEINDIPGLEDALNDKADQSALDKEIQDRKDGDQALQDQIDALDPDGDRKVDWTEIEGKPDKFPPEPHTHDQYLTDETDPVFSASPAASITEEMMAGWSDHTDPYDDTQIKADLASETQARIKGDEALAQDIADLEAAVGGVAGQLAFAGSYDANAGVIVKSNLSEFVEGQPLPDYSTVEGKFVIVAVAGDTPEELGEGDWLVAGESGWVAVKYGTAGSVAWENVVGAPDFLTDAQGSIDGDGKQYVRKNGEWTEATGDSPWERNGDDIYYSDGSVGIGTDSPSGKLHVDGIVRANESLIVTSGGAIKKHDDFGGLSIHGSGGVAISTNTNAQDRLTIDSAGKVGIGMAPLRQASEAKEQLEDWKSAIEERMKAEPKADRSAVTQEITGFEELPTLEQVKERLERAAGDKLQVSGNISASGLIRAENTGSATKIGIYDGTNYTGLQQVGTTFNIRPQGSATIGMSMDGTTGDATFSGTVKAKQLSVSNDGTTRIHLDDTAHPTGKKYLRSNNGRFDIVSHDYTKALFLVDDNGDTTVQYGDLEVTAGNLTVNGTINGVRNVIGTKDLIETLHTLREATKDESTLEGLRDAIGNAVGGLIEKFEAMQSTATQEISE